MKAVNHKPNLSSGTRSTNISAQGPSQSSLNITDNEDGKTSVYKYSGQQRKSKKSYVLIFNQDTQTCTLEPLSSTYNFNIHSTPWESSSSKLVQQYPQLQAKEEDHPGLDDADNIEEGVSDEEPDPDNPYDYRHYINIARDVSPTPSPLLRPTNTGNTPGLHSARPKPTAEAKPRSRPATKTDPLRPAQRKPISKAPQRPTPTVRLDRRASTRPGDGSEKRGPKLPKSGSKGAAKSDYYVHSSDDDEEPTTSQPAAREQSSPSDVDDDVDFNTGGGGLEIDFGDSPPTKRKNKVLALPGSAHGGPISLHSAANSPNSRVVTPRQQRKDRKTEDLVIDFDHSSGGYEEEEEEESDVDALPAVRKKGGDVDVSMQDVSDDEGDEDVEPMSLGSPAHQQQTGGDEEDDADADLDAEFEAQMMQGLADADESEEESEAE